MGFVKFSGLQKIPKVTKKGYLVYLCK